MDEIKSGKELCDSFFENLTKNEDVDSKVANMLKDLYTKGEFTKEKLLQGLHSLRMGVKDEEKS